MTADERLERYARLAVEVGLNVGAGQTVFVNCLVEHAPLARAIARVAYEQGARYVDVEYVDPHVRHARIKDAPEDTLDWSAPWALARIEHIAEHHGALVQIAGDPEPELLADLDGARVGKTRMKELAERYEAPLPQMVDRVAELEARVNGHLERMGFAWSQLKQGAMQELLTGKKRLPGANAEWEQKRLGDVLTIAHGKSQHSVADRNGAYPILATGGQIGTASRFLYDKPSVLIGRKGTIDKLQFMDSPFWTVDTLFYSIVHEPHDAKFLYYRFCLIDWKQHNEASGVPSLNAKTIESIELTMPQYQEQTAIAAILSDMDAELAALEAKLAKARAVKQGMMQALLTGKIRLGNAGF